MSLYRAQESQVTQADESHGGSKDELPCIEPVPSIDFFPISHIAGAPGVCLCAKQYGREY
jgi:hypothetical protein